MDLRHLFLDCLKQKGESPRIIEGNAGHSMIELAGQTAALTDILRKDTSPSNSIGILMPNSRAFIPAFYGSLFAGKIPVPINPLLPPKELVQMLQVIKARTLLTLSPLMPLAQKPEIVESGIEVHFLDQLGEALLKAGPETMAKLGNPQRLTEMVNEEISDVAVMLFSSGTTGLPKAVMLTHQNLIENIRAIQVAYDFSEKDTVFGMLPFFHSYGLCALNLALLGGARYLMVPRFNPAETLRAIREHDITILMLVPEMFKVLARLDGVKDIDWSRVRLCITGGGPSSAALRELWRETTGHTLYAGYGLTEYSPVVSIGIPGQYKEDSVGKPLPGVSIRIVDSSGHDLSAGKDGEILVKGPSTMKGYFEQPEATAQMIDAEGWLHTGDVGRVDEEGFLYISGRAKDIIIVAGENVLPQEVEDALALHPAVAESSVIGVPDDVRGEVPVAFVVLRPDQSGDASELRSFLRDHLVAHKVPREIRFVSQLPKTSLGKVIRRQLKEMFQSEAASE